MHFSAKSEKKRKRVIYLHPLRVFDIDSQTHISSDSSLQPEGSIDRLLIETHVNI